MTIRCAIALPCVLLIAACAHHSPALTHETSRWANAQQLVLVTTANWDASSGQLRMFERDGAGWRQFGAAANITVGRSGSAWGLGLHRMRSDGPIKREGDGRAPAGVFAIGPAFGYAEHIATGLRYQAMTINDWCIDVPASPYYNQIINRSLVKAPLLEQSTEPMRRDLHADGDQRYREGFVIQHNPRNLSGAGSCIFAHLWKAADITTAGCTAMAPASMDALLLWLDSNKHPVFVALPLHEYQMLQRDWRLPALTSPEQAP